MIPHHGADAVEHDASTRADAMAAECGIELPYRRHHEAKPRGVVGKFALQIEEVSAGGVPRLEAAAPGDRNVRIIAPRWRRLQIGGAVKDPQIAPAQVACQFVGANQGVRLAHLCLLRRIGLAGAIAGVRSSIRRQVSALRR
jgi:hypothetical protein